MLTTLRFQIEAAELDLAKLRGSAVVVAGVALMAAEEDDPPEWRAAARNARELAALLPPDDEARAQVDRLLAAADLAFDAHGHGPPDDEPQADEDVDEPPSWEAPDTEYEEWLDVGWTPEEGDQ